MESTLWDSGGAIRVTMLVGMILGSGLWAQNKADSRVQKNNIIHSMLLFPWTSTIFMQKTLKHTGIAGKSTGSTAA